MEKYIINKILSIMGYEMVDGNSLKKSADNIFYVKAAFGNQYAVDVLCDKAEEFKLTYPQVMEYLNISIDDDGTRDYVNNVRLKIIFEFKNLSTIDQLAAYLKLL